MSSEEILRLVSEYGLTLRCFPTHVVGFSHYRDGYRLKDGETLVDKTFRDGTVVKMVRREEFRAPKWGVKIGEWPQWTKNDFYGPTPEDAVVKAVKHLESLKSAR